MIPLKIKLNKLLRCLRKANKLDSKIMKGI